MTEVAMREFGEDYGYKVTDVDGDGNCFIYAVQKVLKELHKKQSIGKYNQELAKATVYMYRKGFVEYAIKNKSIDFRVNYVEKDHFLRDKNNLDMVWKKKLQGKKR